MSRLWSRLMTTADTVDRAAHRAAPVVTASSSASVGRVTNANSQTILRQFTYFTCIPSIHSLPQHFAAQVHRNAHNEQEAERIALLREAQQMAESDRSRQFFHRHHIGQFAHFITRFSSNCPCCFAALGLLTEMPHVVRSTSARGSGTST